MELSTFKRDTSKVEDGQWVTNEELPGLGDTKFRVRGLSSAKVNAYRARKERAVPRKERNVDGSLKDDTAIRVFSEVMAEIVLLEWDGLTNDGKAVPYDPETAKSLFLDPDMRPLLDAVTAAATVADRMAGLDKEEAAKN